MNKTLKTFSFLLLAGFSLPVAVVAEECKNLIDTFQQAAKSGQENEIQSGLDRIMGEASCPDTLRAEAKRVASRAYYRITQDKVQQGKPLASQEPLLVKALQLGLTWQPAASLGDIALDRKDYEKASQYYQQAMNIINDAAATPKVPDASVIEGIFRRAQESRMLAKRYVNNPKDHRSGANGGLAMPNVRGFVIQKVAIPITFETDSTRLTPDGVYAAKDLFAMLAAEGSKQITLVGHTDERGDPHYNQRLSEKRASVVKEFLETSGIRARITVVGMGPREPLPLENPRRYSREEIWQLNRRVELDRQ